jgi:hypothetical protein
MRLSQANSVARRVLLVRRANLEDLRRLLVAGALAFM